MNIYSSPSIQSRLTSTAFAAIGAFCLFAPLTSTSAAVVFSDVVPLGGSDYASSAVGGANTLFGQNPVDTIGFTAGWAGSSSNLGTSQGTSSNLSVTGILGNDATTGALRLNGGSGIASRSYNRAFTSISGASSLWLGAVLQTNASGLITNNGAMIGVLSGTLASNTGATATASFWSATNGSALHGFAVGEKNGFLTIDYQTAAGGPTAFGETITSVALTAGTPYFLVASVDLNTSGSADTLKVWIRTSAPSSSGLLGTADFTITTADLLTSSQDVTNLTLMDGSSDTSGPIYFADAMRMGTTYGDLLVAVPEPSTVASLAFAGISLLFLRRRKQYAKRVL